MTDLSLRARRWRWLAVLAFGLLSIGPVLASEGVEYPSAGVDLDDRASLQRGAKLFVNYCSGCHSLKYMRYSRLAADLGLSEKDVQAELNFRPEGKVGDLMISAIPHDNAVEWFYKLPPDLSLVARVRGPDWISAYLKSFYLDESRPVGWNNTVFQNALMPNPLWELQGLAHPEYGKVDAVGDRPVEKIVLTQPGRLSPAEFDRSVRDITAFLTYVGEPAALKRPGVGVWVILFLALFTFLAWQLKHAFWRDVH
jgi:ubiquinol-cytochrome c reductase cytochrome c1 subunit